MATAAEILLFVVSAFLLFLASTVVFDTVHWVLHRWMGSRWRALRFLGGFHAVHHRFLDSQLQVHPDLIGANIRHHVIPEYLTQLSVSLVMLLVLPTPIVLGTIGIQTGLVTYILSRRGMDVNHRTIERLAAYKPSFICPPEYHALHHVHPSSYISAFLKVVDYSLATGVDLQGRSVVITGAGSPFADTLADELRAAGATVASIAAHDAAVPEPGTIFVLAHGDDSPPYTACIESAIEERGDGLIPPEIWALDAGADLDRYYRSRRVIYRHIATTPDTASPAMASRVVFGVRRGFNFLPVRAVPGAVADYRRFRTRLKEGRRLARRAAAVA